MTTTIRRQRQVRQSAGPRKDAVPAAAGTRPPTAGTGRDRGRRWTLVATSLGFAVGQLDVSVVNVAIRPIGARRVFIAGFALFTVASIGLVLGAVALAAAVGRAGHDRPDVTDRT